MSKQQIVCDVDFRRRQALADLQGLAALAGDPIIARITPSETGRLRALIDAGCQLKVDPDFGHLREPLELAAFPDADPDACVAAAAILLADCLQGGVDPESIALTHEFLAPFLGTAPRLHRAILLNGFEAIAQSLPERPFDRPDPADCISAERDDLLKPLLAIVRRVSDEELHDVARIDRHSSSETHLAALRQVIFEQDCRMTDDQNWYPSEAVELAAYVGSSPGFIPMTALLMVNALETGDGYSWMESRWGSLAETYLALPPSAAHPLLAGFRHLYETVEHWSPSNLPRRKEPRKPVMTIPLVCDPLRDWRRGELGREPK